MRSPLLDGATEIERQRSTARYGLAGGPGWPAQDSDLVRLTALARRLLGAQSGAINILDGDRQVTLVASGAAELGTCTRSDGLCDRLLRLSETPDELVVIDTQRDPRLRGNPFVHGGRGALRFYAATPLVGREGLVLGTLCVWSDDPTPVSPRQRRQLVTVGKAVMAVLDARRRRLPEPDTRRVEPARARPHSDPPVAAVPSVPAAARTGAAWTIDAVIDDRAIRSVFQPIVHLASGTIAGFEALSRGPAGSSLESPAALIDSAKAAGRLGELDWLCRTHAMQAAASAGLHPSLSWFVNVEPAGLSIECPPHLLAPLSRARTDLRVILEVVERDVDGYVLDLLRATDQARRDSWGVALDDVGAEEASLALLPFLRPDVVKLDMSLLDGVPKAAAAAVTAAVRAYAERTGAVILAEGIETAEQQAVACVLGATYGQGYLFGRPGPLPAHVPAPRHVIPLRQRLSPLANVTPFEALQPLLGEPSRASKAHLLHISRFLEQESARREQAAVLLASFQDSTFFSHRKRRDYEDLASANALTVVVGAGLEPYRSPRFKIAAPAAGSHIADEWVVILVSPHFAAAFVGRDVGDTGPDSRRRFDYYYTFDRDAIIAAARAYLGELRPTAEAHAMAEADAMSEGEAGALAPPPGRNFRTPWRPQLGEGRPRTGC